MVSLRNKTKQGLIWSSFDKGGQQIVQFFISIIIARGLLPSDYGLIGMLSIFIAIASTFIDSGLGEALIQKKAPDPIDFTSAFIFNIFSAVGLYLVLFFCAPIIAKFYQEPQLVLITRILGLSLIISSLSIIRFTLLKIQIDFKTTTLINITASIISGFVGIYMAYNNYGVWSLISQTIISLSLKTALIWIIVKWKIKMVFDYNRFKELFRFSSRLLISWLINQFITNIYSIIIGKFYNATSLGYYTQGRRMQEIPSNSINVVFQNVTYPVLAELNNSTNGNNLKKAYRKIIKLIVSINFPLMIVLIVISKPLIIFLLTSKWESSIIFFKLFCIIGLVFPLTAINLNITKVRGNTNLYMKLVIIKRSLFIIALLLTVRMGIELIIIGQIISTYVGAVIEMKYSGAMIDYKLKEQIRDIAPFLISSMLIGACTYLPVFFITQNFLLLVSQLFISFSLFVLSHYILKTELYNEVIAHLKLRLV